MNKLLLILALGLLACKPVASPEEQLYNCWDRSFKICDLSLAAEIRNFENNLIENGYLKDSTWNSYKNLLDSLSREEEPQISRTIPMNEFLDASLNLRNSCYDSALILRIPKLSILIDNFNKKTGGGKSVFAPIYAQISNIINAMDFKSPLYKTWVIFVLASNSTYSNLFKALLPKDDPTVPIMLTISIDSLENYYIDSVKADLKTIKTRLQNLNCGTKPCKIALRADKSVSVQKAIEIMDICQKYNIQLKLEVN